MKFKTSFVPLLTTLLLAGLIGLSSCATTGTKQSAKPRSTLPAVANTIQQTIIQVDATGASLQELIKPDQADLQHAFAVYAANVDKMDTLATQMDQHSNRINASGKEYFSEWEQGGTYANPQIQRLNGQHRAALSEKSDQIPQANVGVGSGLHAYMSYILETQMYLAKHLTRQGIETITPVARRGIKGGEDFKAALRRELSIIEQVNAVMPPVQGDPVPAPVSGQ